MSVNSLLPIHTLNDDVLLYIFTINTNMFSDSQALHRTWVTSQVCREWRSLMLDTPSLWAKLIDMDAIYRAPSLELGHELIRRSGAAPLWISAASVRTMGYPCRYATNKDLAKFFFGVITKNWPRIQKLVVRGDKSIFSLSRAMLSFPAPQLEHFEAPSPHVTVTVHDGLPDPEPPITPLFAGHAPVLRKFILSDYAAEYWAPWLCHLRFIELNRAYTVCYALALLSATHDLKELKIQDIASGDLSTPLPSATLLHLKRLDYYGPVQQCAALLHRLRIPPGCSVIIRISHLPDHERITERKRQFLSFVNVFARYAKRYFGLPIVDKLDLEYTPGFSVAVQGQTKAIEKCPLRINIALMSDDRDSYHLKTFVQKIALLDLASITKLGLHTYGPFDPCFVSVFIRLTSVATMEINSVTLKSLMDLERYMTRTSQPIIIFPLLKIVELHLSALRCKYSLVDQVKLAMQFILMRVRNGHPINMLDMTKYAYLDFQPYWELVREAKGLKVLYKRPKVKGIFEYICGSGDEERHIMM